MVHAGPGLCLEQKRNIECRHFQAHPFMLSEEIVLFRPDVRVQQIFKKDPKIRIGNGLLGRTAAVDIVPGRKFRRFVPDSPAHGAAFISPAHGPVRLMHGNAHAAQHTSGG